MPRLPLLTLGAACPGPGKQEVKKGLASGPVRGRSPGAYRA